MNFVKKTPLKIWCVIIICYLTPIFCEETLFDSTIFELQWFLYIFPIFFFAYYYGLRVGIISSILSNLCFLFFEWMEVLNGETLSTWKGYLIFSISLISFSIAIGIGILANKLNKLTIIDPLTNVFNRRYIDLYQTGKKRISIFFIDLDRFKYINDSLGHWVGDQILQTVAKRLKEQLDEKNMIARLGGDEFVVIINEVKKMEVKKIAKEILQKLSAPYFIKGNELFLTASMGISQSTYHLEDLNDLIIKADIAMYKAKQLGKNQFHFYNRKMNDSILELTRLEIDLHKALKQKEFVLYYQPKIDLKTNKMIGMEALVRWARPNQGLIPPAKFISVAEETGLIVPLGAWVLYKACKQNKEWQDAGYTPLRISVNISARQFQSHLVSTVKNVLKQTGLAPEWLELEITESVLMKNLAGTSQTLQQLRQLGIHFSIDDFGTGYCSLSYLKNLPIDCLKIDQSFVRDIAADNSFVNAMVTLGHNLNIRVIAEGIEEYQQVHALQQLNCDFGQGYLYSPPISKNQFEHKFLSSELVC